MRLFHLVLTLFATILLSGHAHVLVELTKVARLPVGATHLAIGALPHSVSAVNVTVGGTDGVSVELTATRPAPYSALYAPLPASAVAIPGTLLLESEPTADGSHATARASIDVYDVPIFASVTAATVDGRLTTAGLSHVNLVLAYNSPALPVLNGKARVVCTNDATVAPPAQIVQYDASTASDASSSFGSSALIINSVASTTAYSYDADITPLPDGSGIRFLAASVPAVDCGAVHVYVSVNDGVHWHLATATTAPLPVVRFRPIKSVTLFPSDLSVLWNLAHNRARILLGTWYASAIDASAYALHSWQPEPVTGRDVASLAMRRAIEKDNATLLLCVGGEYYEAAHAIARAYPHVNLLFTSDIVANLTEMWGETLPNAATGHGRVYEAMYYVGLIAAATTKNGKLGFILSLDHPSTQAQLNAFALGAQAAEAAGLCAACDAAAGKHVQVYAWTVGTFNDIWAELTAANDLLDRIGVDFLYSVTDNAFQMREQAHLHGAYSGGLYDDGRATQGDFVLISMLLNTQAIYLEFVRRMVVGEPFGPASFERGFAATGGGVTLTQPSPLVPLIAQAYLRRRLAVSMERDDVEEIFCGTLVDTNGTVVLEGSTGATADGQASVTGEDGRACLSYAAIHRMDWNLQGVHMPPPDTDPSRCAFGRVGCSLWVPPSQSGPFVWTPSDVLRGSVASLPTVTLLMVVLTYAFLWASRKTKTIRYASPVFLATTNVGAALHAASLLLLAGMPITDNNCLAWLWLQGIGFALLYGALFVKMHRIHKLFNNATLKRVVFKDSKVGKLLLLVLAAECAFLLLLTLLLPPAAEVVERNLATTAPISTLSISVNPDAAISDLQYTVCGTGGPYREWVSVYVLLSAGQFALLLWGSWLSFRTRAVPDDFRDSHYVGFAIYNTVVCEAVGFVADYFVRYSPTAQYLGAVVRLGLPPIFTLALLYLPKYLLLRNIGFGSSRGSGSIADGSSGVRAGDGGATPGAGVAAGGGLGAQRPRGNGKVSPVADGHILSAAGNSILEIGRAAGGAIVVQEPGMSVFDYATIGAATGVRVTPGGVGGVLSGSAGHGTLNGSGTAIDSMAAIPSAERAMLSDTVGEGETIVPRHNHRAHHFGGGEKMPAIADTGESPTVGARPAAAAAAARGRSRGGTTGTGGASNYPSMVSEHGSTGTYGASLVRDMTGASVPFQNYQPPAPAAAQDPALSRSMMPLPGTPSTHEA